MHYMIARYNLSPGDRIIEPKSNLRLVQHHSIYLGSDFDGTDWIVENKIGYGVRIVDANTYFREVFEITGIVRFSGNGFERQLAVQKALREVGKPYNLINFNCEHFANYVQNGQRTSSQIVGGGVAASLLALLLFAAFSE